MDAGRGRTNPFFPPPTSFHPLVEPIYGCLGGCTNPFLPPPSFQRLMMRLSVNGESRDQGSGRRGREGVCDVTRQMLPSSSRRCSNFFSSCGLGFTVQSLRSMVRIRFSSRLRSSFPCSCSDGSSLLLGRRAFFHRGDQKQLRSHHERKSGDQRPHSAVEPSGLPLHRRLEQRIVVQDHFGGRRAQGPNVRKKPVRKPAIPP